MSKNEVYLYKILIQEITLDSVIKFYSSYCQIICLEENITIGGGGGCWHMSIFEWWFLFKGEEFFGTDRYILVLLFQYGSLL